MFFQTFQLYWERVLRRGDYVGDIHERDEKDVHYLYEILLQLKSGVNGRIMVSVSVGGGSLS